jgi:hypothetical protein
MAKRNVMSAAAPGKVVAPQQTSRLPKDSGVNISQVTTLDKQHLTEAVAALTPEEDGRGLRRSSARTRPLALSARSGCEDAPRAIP